MQILGHELIPYKALKSVSCIEEIRQEDDKIILFEYEAEIIKYANDLKIEFALHVFNQTEAIIGNAAGATILICPLKIAHEVATLAEYYLFDAKVAILINNEDEIQLAIENKVDMAILPEAII